MLHVLWRRSLAALSLVVAYGCSSSSDAPSTPGGGDDAGAIMVGDGDAGGADDAATAPDATVDDAGTAPDATIGPDAGTDAPSSDAGADSPAPSCTQSDLDALKAAPEALDAAFAPALARGLVFEPALDALFARDRTVAAALEALAASCDPTAATAALADVAALEADVAAWVTAAPLGFSSVPPTFATVGQVVEYDARLAGAPSGYTFSIPAGPSGITIDSATGKLQFTPTLADKGPRAISVEATDGATVAKQSFTLTVAQRTVRLSQAITPSAAITLTITAPGSALDGAKVAVPVGAVAAADTLVLAELDPAPPVYGRGRIVGSALEVSLASGVRQLAAPLEVDLPSPGLQAGEEASLVEWAAGSSGFGHIREGVYSFTDTAGVTPPVGRAVGQLPRTGVASAAATPGSPIRATSGGYRFVADPSVKPAELTLFVDAVNDAHAAIVTAPDGHLDPTTNGPVVVAVRSHLERGTLGLAPHRQKIVLSSALRGLTKDNITAHELFHLVQMHTPWKLDHGLPEYEGGAMWWMEATAEFVAHRHARLDKFRLFKPAEFLSTTLTTWESDGFQQYNAFIFFDYLVTRHGFNMKSFWQTVQSSELMAPASAGTLLSAYASLDVDGVPYGPFVRAFAADRSAQNFSLAPVIANAPLFPVSAMPDAEADHVVATGQSLPFLSSRTYVVNLPSGTADKLFYATLNAPAGVSVSVYDNGTGALVKKIVGGSGEQTLGALAGKSLAMHLVNPGVEAALNATASLSLRMKNVPVTTAPIEVWYLYGVWQYRPTPLDACASWVSTVPGGSSPRIVANTGTCYVDAQYCCWYTHTSNPDAGNVGVIKAYDCPAGYTNVSGTCTRN